MDITARKTAFVKAFMELQSEELISQFEKLLRKFNSPENEYVENPFSKEELEVRLTKSMEDYKNGRYKTTEELMEKYK